MTPDIDIKRDVDAELRWNPEIDDTDIATKVNKGVVTLILRGEVRSWSERDQAQASAWSAPGVTNVKNEISIRT
jgi:osmotically-inducible protein OsmY